MKMKALLVLAMFCISIAAAVAAGSTNAAEVMVGAKNSGAPSQQLADRMGLMLQGLKEVKGECFNGTVKSPESLVKHGFTGAKAGEPVQFEKTGEMLYKITLPKSGQSKVFKVRFKD